MKKRINILIACVLVFSMVLNLNFSYAMDKEFSTSTMFVTEDVNEQDFITNIEEKIKDNDFVDKNRIGKSGIDELNKKIKSNSVKFPSDLEGLDINNVESLFFNGDLLNNSKVVDFAHKQLENGKNIYFYGNNMDVTNFCKLFGLDSSIEKDVEGKKLNDAEPMVEEEGITENKVVSFVGAEKNQWGNSLIIGRDIDYNFYRTVDFLLKDAVHAKKVKVNKPYESFNSKNSDTNKSIFKNNAEASDIDAYPICNSTRWATAFNNNTWYVINDLYLHRVSDSDPGADYFIMESISEFDMYYGVPANSACYFYTRIKSYYIDDYARAGGPESQSDKVEVNVNFYPPSVGFTFIPGGEVDVDGYLSLSSNYYSAMFNESNTFSNCFEPVTIFRTQYSFKVDTLGGQYSMVKLAFYQNAEEILGGDIVYSYNNDIYSYDY